jgi:hypothetical protein
VLRAGLRRARLHEAFLFVRTNGNDDFVRRKCRKRIPNGEADIRHPGDSIDGLARKLLSRAFGDPLRMSERFLIVGKPIEHTLPDSWHHDLDGFCVADMRAQDVVGMFDGADDEDVPTHDATVSKPPRGVWPRCGPLSSHRCLTALRSPSWRSGPSSTGSTTRRTTSAGCDADCWCRRTAIGRIVKWWFPARWFGIHHKNSFFDGMSSAEIRAWKREQEAKGLYP